MPMLHHCSASLNRRELQKIKKTAISLFIFLKVVTSFFTAVDKSSTAAKKGLPTQKPEKKEAGCKIPQLQKKVVWESMRLKCESTCKI